MTRFIVTGLVALLMTAGLTITATPAHAGCQYGGPVLSKCDGPVQPDGTWQRCVGVPTLTYRGASSYLVPEKRCDVMGPDRRPADLVIADPPTHIDD